jgi:hypothetical protein
MVPARAIRATLALGLLIPQLTGCYHYVPVQSSDLPHGAEVSIGITDAGRMNLSERVGPGVRRIGGQVLATTDSTLVLSVRMVDYIDQNLTARWAGERLDLSRHIVREIQERRLSRSRSLFMAGLVAIATFAASKIAISGFGGERGSDRPGGEPGQQQ